MELPRFAGRDHVLAQHQIGRVALGNDHTLIAGKAKVTAGVEEPLDLLVHATDGLDVAELVDGTGHGDGLFERHPGQGAEQAADLRARGGVAVDAAVALLERHGRAEGQGMLRLEQMPQAAAENMKPLGVDGTRKRGRAFDVDQPRPAGSDGGGDPRREAIGNGA